MRAVSVGVEKQPQSNIDPVEMFEQVSNALSQLYALMTPRQKKCYMFVLAPNCTGALSHYLGSGMDESKKQHLLNSGFPELCAIFYFFETSSASLDNIFVLETDVYYLGFYWDGHDIVSRLDFPDSRHKNQFLITDEAIDVFPKIHAEESDPYFKVTALCEELRNYAPEIFREKCYRQLLKMIIASDKQMEEIINTVITDGKVAENFYQQWKRRKSALRHNKSGVFYQWWKKLTKKTVQSILTEFSVSDLGDVQKQYRQFCFDTYENKAYAILSSLNAVVLSIRNEMERCPTNVLGPYEPMVALRNAFYNYTQLFFQKWNKSGNESDEIVCEYICCLSRLMDGLELWPYTIFQSIAAGCQKVVVDINNFIDELEKYFYVSDIDFRLPKEKNIGTCLENVNNDDFVFVDDESTALVNHVIAWLCEERIQLDDQGARCENQLVVLKLFEYARSEFLHQEEARLANRAVKATAKVADIVSNTASMFGSIFSNRGSTSFFATPHTDRGTPSIDFNSSHKSFFGSQSVDPFPPIHYQLKSVETPRQLLAALIDFFQTKKESVVAVREQFVRALIRQVAREVLAKCIVHQFQKMPRFPASAEEMLINPVEDATLIEVKKLLLSSDALSQKLKELNTSITQTVLQQPNNENDDDDFFLNVLTDMHEPTDEEIREFSKQMRMKDCEECHSEQLQPSSLTL